MAKSGENPFRVYSESTGLPQYLDEWERKAIEAEQRWVEGLRQNNPFNMPGFIAGSSGFNWGAMILKAVATWIWHRFVESSIGQMVLSDTTPARAGVLANLLTYIECILFPQYPSLGRAIYCLQPPPLSDTVRAARVYRDITLLRWLNYVPG
jgi:hypothetical protein